MPQLRKDPITGRWVIIDDDNVKRAGDFEIEDHTLRGGVCPFCYGNEHMTPPEILVNRKEKGEPNTPGWFTRVVPNKFPALKIEGELDKVGIGMYDKSNGIGAHEVIIENPDHSKDLPDLDYVQMERVIRAYKSRCIDLRGDKRFKYILIFKNFGESAGASLEHPHTQLAALPFIPKRVNEEIKGSHQYFQYRERCVFCDMVQQELDSKERIVCENREFVSFVPFMPRFPYEVWILPKKHSSDFSSIDDSAISELAKMLRDTLLRMKKCLKTPSYNFIIHTSPIEDIERDDYHWHFEIMPRLTRVAGFEWGTGFYINPTPPEIASECLRNIEI